MAGPSRPVRERASKATRRACTLAKHQKPELARPLMGNVGTKTKSNMSTLAGVLLPLPIRTDMAGAKGEAVADAAGNARTNAGGKETVPTAGNLMMLDLRNIAGGTLPAMHPSKNSVARGHADDLAVGAATAPDFHGVPDLSASSHDLPDRGLPLPMQRNESSGLVGNQSTTGLSRWGGHE